MTLYKLLAPAEDLAAAISISNSLAELSDPAAGAVSMFEAGRGSWTVEAYYDGAPELAAIIDALGDRAGGGPATPRLEPVRHENWVALSQEALAPVAAGRFVVHGRHDRHRAAARHYAIEIDAGEAFGTAHHETTRGCLTAIDALTRTRSFSSVLDLGCGTAVLAIAAARALPRAAIVASDNDAQAAAVATRNVRKNAARRRVEVITAGGMSHRLLRRAGGFDLILANILAAPLIELAPAIARALESGGIAVLSGLLTNQARQVSAAYAAAGFSLIRHQRLGEWSTLTVKRRFFLAHGPHRALK